MMLPATSNNQGSGTNSSCLFGNCGGSDTSKDDSSPFACLFGASENDSAVEDLFLQLQRERLNPKIPAPASPTKPQRIVDSPPPSPAKKNKKRKKKQKTASPPNAWPWVPNNKNDSLRVANGEDNGSDGDAIAEALLKLTKEQREDAMHDVHGVVKNRCDSDGKGQEDIESNPTKLEHVLRMMDYELSKQSASSPTSVSNAYDTKATDPSSALTIDIDDGTSNAYKLALQMKPAYVNDVKMKLQFLRAARYDPVEAATRMISLLDIKLERFGIEKLTKECITIDDLREDDVAT